MPQLDPGLAPQSATTVRPPAMDQAVLLMKVGAALSLVGLLLTFVSRGAIRDGVQQASQDAGGTMTAAQVDAAVSVGIATGIAGGLIGVALWLWMASANGKGRPWARIVATVFFAISVLSGLFALSQPGPILSRLLSIVSVLLGAYIIVLLYKKESTEFYRAGSGPRA